jgi:hypothetical protein
LHSKDVAYFQKRMEKNHSMTQKTTSRFFERGLIAWYTQGWLSSINGWSTSATVNTPALCTLAMPNPASPARMFYNDANDLSD